MPGPYSSLMVLRAGVEAAAEGSGCLKKTDLRGLWEIYCRLKRHCGVILSYMAKYLPSRFKVPPLRLEIHRDWFTMTLLSEFAERRKFYGRNTSLFGPRLEYVFWNTCGIRAEYCQYG